MPTQNKSPLPSFHLQIPTAPFPSPDTQILSFIWGPWCPVVVLFSPFASSLNYASYFECYVMLDKRWENHCKIFSLQIITQKWTHYLLQVKTHHVCLCSRCMRKMKKHVSFYGSKNGQRSRRTMRKISLTRDCESTVHFHVWRHSTLNFCKVHCTTQPRYLPVVYNWSCAITCITRYFTPNMVLILVILYDISPSSQLDWKQK